MPLGKQDIAQHFTQRFGQVPRWIVRAPAGSTSSASIPTTTTASCCRWPSTGRCGSPCGPRKDRRVVVHSIDYNESGEFALNGMVHEKAHWIEYLKGVAWALHDAGFTLTGWEGVLSGDVPLGAGLSSSAAVEMATARAFAVAGGLPWEPAAMAKLGQRAENKWIGVNCGIMDQMISASGRAGHAMLLDCRSLETRSRRRSRPTWRWWCWTRRRAAGWSIRLITSGVRSARRRRNSSASRRCGT